MERLLVNKERLRARSRCILPSTFGLALSSDRRGGAHDALSVCHRSARLVDSNAAVDNHTFTSTVSTSELGVGEIERACLRTNKHYIVPGCLR